MIKLIEKTLIVITLLLSFNVNANLKTEAERFLTSISKNEGVWFYHPENPSLQAERLDVFIKTYQTLEAIDRNSIIQKLAKKLHFYQNHVLLLIKDRKNLKREQAVRLFAKKNNLKLITIDKGSHKDFITLIQSHFDLFVVNPNKRQISEFNSLHPEDLSETYLSVLLNALEENSRSEKI